jgi:drug/metabolite transporter (DMT)-like permease
MSLLALVIIIVSAFMHASWNYLAKRSDSGFVFVWLYLGVTAVFYAPFVIGLFIVQHISIGWAEIGLIAGSALIHLAYALLLQKGYKIGDLSLIYPVARGTGPLIVAITAFFLYQEKLTTLGTTGIVFIIAGVFIITGGFQVLRGGSLLPVGYGVLIGVMIAGYTLLDKGAVSVFAMSPLLLNYGSFLGQFLLLSPFAKKEWPLVRKTWRLHRREAIGVGILSPLAYILVLTTMVFTPVSYVAPVREISILIGAVMGTYLLKEGFGARRIIAAMMVVIGVTAVALS